MLYTIVLYVIPGCPHCEAAAEDMRARNVRFRLVDVVSSHEALEDFLSLDLPLRFPVIMDHEKVSLGWRGSYTEASVADLEELVRGSRDGVG